jgi:tetratricopeptide (TPR) repeat protein
MITLSRNRPYILNFKFLLLLFAVCFCCNSSHAQAGFNFNNRCINAYKDILGLRINHARALISEEKQQDPKNSIPILLDNYADFFSLLVSDNRADYENLKGKRSERIDALENNDPNSPYYLFAQAEIYLQWGIVKAKFGDYTSAFLDMKKARSLLKDNVAKYPDFLPAQKDIALLDVILGALPSNIKGIAKFLGMSGNTNRGITQLEALRPQLLNTKYSYYTDEVIFYLCYVHINVLHTKNNYAQLISYLKNMDDKSTLRHYLEGYTAAKNVRTDEAITVLSDIAKTKQQIVLPSASYLLGNAKLARMDSDANVYLQRYINEYKGDNYIKDTYLKLAYYSLLHNDESRYNYYLNMVRTKGYARDEKDKQALREANDPPYDRSLLKARLAYDGGYYEQALAQIATRQVNDFKLLRDKIEYSYRLGRIYQKLDKPNDAIASYQKAIALGRSTPYYYAASAALYIGEILEQYKDYNKAATYYKQALDMKNHEYQNSTDNEAKEGLSRIHR